MIITGILLFLIILGLIAFMNGALPGIFVVVICILILMYNHNQEYRDCIVNNRDSILEYNLKYKINLEDAKLLFCK